MDSATPSYAWMSDLGIGQLCFAPLYENQNMIWKGSTEVYKDPELKQEEGRDCYSADMKAGCAALMVAFARLAKQRRAFRGKLILTLVCDEEGPWGLGCDALLSSGLLPETVDFILSTEPTAASTF